MGMLLRYPYEVRDQDGIFRRYRGRQDHQGDAGSCEAHRRTEVRAFRAR